MKANEQGSRGFLWPAVATLLCVATVVTAMSSMPALARPPDPDVPQPEPIHIRLDQSLAGALGGGAVSASRVRVAADPGTWYDLLDPPQGFDSEAFFPPTNWEVITESGAGWAQQSAQQLSGSYSAGVVTATAGTLNTWLFYGGSTGFSLETVADAELMFSYWLNTENTGNDPVYFGWASSPDGQNFYGARISGRVSKWLTATLDLQQYVGDDSVWIAFFVNGTSTSGTQQVYVDNVKVRGMEPYKVYLAVALKDYEAPATAFTFTDDFSDLNSGWPHVLQWGSTREEQGYITGYTDKFVADYPNDYTIVGGACRRPQTYFVRNGEWAEHIIAKPGLMAGSQFVMEVDIAYCDDALFASTGLVFGLNDSNTEYYRVILIYDPGGGGTIKYAVWRESHILVNTSPSSHLNGGYNTNRVKVVRDGCNLSLYFNDHLEWSSSNECYYIDDQRQVGFFHDRYPNHGKTGATLDNFRLEGAMYATGSDQKVVVWTTESWPVERALEGVDYMKWHDSSH